MKLSFRDIESFVKAPNPAARVILVYGPDGGLMRERAAIIGKTVVADLNDPFNVAALSTQILLDDPARLSAEAGAISMMGGNRLIRVTDAADKLTPLIKDYLAAAFDTALVILEAGELGPRSSLRALCEKAQNAAALPCYVEDERDLTRFIQSTVQEAGKTIDRDAASWLAAAISGDRQKARSEIEKLLIYKGAETTPISLEDAQAICGEAGAQGLDDLVYSVGGRNAEKALAVYAKLSEEGVNFVVILRALQNHFRRLHRVQAMMLDGQSAEQAVKSLAPPIFFKQEPAFRAQVQAWPLRTLDRVLARLMELEAQCKTTGAPAETLCAQTVLGISMMRGR